MKIMKKRYIPLIAAALILTIAFSGCGKKKAGAEQVKKIKEVKVDMAIIGSISKKITANSEFEPFKEVTQVSESGGDLKTVYVINGKWVKEGDKIMEIQNDQLEAQYQQAKAQYSAAKATYERAKKLAEDQTRNSLVKADRAQVSAKMALDKAKKGTKQEQKDQLTYSINSAKSAYETAKLNYENYKKLFDKNLISEQQFMQIKMQFEASENAFNSAQKQLDLANKGTDDEDVKIMEAAVKDAEDSYKITKKMVDEEMWRYDIQGVESTMDTAKANLDLIEKKYKELTVYAKISGVITNLEVKEKNKIAPGTQLFTIVNNDDMIIRVGLNEREVIGVEKFNKSTVFSEALDGYFDGSVYEINPVADKRTRKYDVKVKIKNSDHSLKKGMFGSVTINVDEHEALLVPKKAIVVGGLNSYVFKIEENVAKKIVVELGADDKDNQEVKSEELGEGDDIVVEGQFLLTDGDKVKIKESGEVK